MFLKKLIFLLTIAALCFPAIAYAGDIDVEAGNVRVNVDKNGRTYSNSRSRWSKYPYSRSYWDWYRRYPRSSSMSCSRRGSVVRQESTQTTTRSGRTVTRSQTSTYCR